MLYVLDLASLLPEPSNLNKPVEQTQKGDVHMHYLDVSVVTDRMLRHVTTYYHRSSDVCQLMECLRHGHKWKGHILNYMYAVSLPVRLLWCQGGASRLASIMASGNGDHWECCCLLYITKLNVFLQGAVLFLRQSFTQTY